MRATLLYGLLVGVIEVSLAAQAPGLAQFDVASIKPNTSGDTRRMLGPAPGGRFLAVNVTLRQLIAFAFGVTNSRSDMLVLGGPAWVDSARFDVEAVVSGGALAPGTAGPLVRKLLEQRFALRAHRETTEQPVYHLVVDRTDGRLGPNLRPTATNCEERRVARAAGAPVPPITPVRPPADPSTVRPQCGVRVAPGQIAGDGVTAADIAEPLASFAGRLIIDRTGLRQYFDVDLKWAAEPGAAGGPPNDLPPLVTALKEQLGVRLEDTRGPVEVVIIDAVAALVPN